MKHRIWIMSNRLFRS